MIKVAIVDDHQFVIDGLLALLKHDPEIEVQRAYNSGHNLIRDLDTYEFDVILMDMNMPEINGFETTDRIMQSNPQQRILMFSMDYTESHVAKAKKVGARGFVSKSEEVQSLIQSIKNVDKGLDAFPTSKNTKVIQ